MDLEGEDAIRRLSLQVYWVFCQNLLCWTLINFRPHSLMSFLIGSNLKTIYWQIYNWECWFQYLLHYMKCPKSNLIAESIHNFYHHHSSSANFHLELINKSLFSLNFILIFEAHLQLSHPFSLLLPHNFIWIPQNFNPFMI